MTRVAERLAVIRAFTKPLRYCVYNLMNYPAARPRGIKTVLTAVAPPLVCLGFSRSFPPPANSRVPLPWRHSNRLSKTLLPTALSSPSHRPVMPSYTSQETLCDSVFATHSGTPCIPFLHPPAHLIRRPRGKTTGNCEFKNRSSITRSLRPHFLWSRSASAWRAAFAFPCRPLVKEAIVELEGSVLLLLFT